MKKRTALIIAISALAVAVLLAIPLVLAAECVEDTDDGDVPETYGTVLDVNDTELCADSCSGAVLTECTCVGGETVTVTHDCALDSKICSDGACVCYFEEGESCDTEPVGECEETEDNWGAACDWQGCELTFSERKSEDCDDEKDNDCDGKTDCADPNCGEESYCADAVSNTSDEDNTSTEIDANASTADGGGEAGNETATEESSEGGAWSWVKKYALFGWLSPWW